MTSRAAASIASHGDARPDRGRRAVPGRRGARRTGGGTPRPGRSRRRRRSPTASGSCRCRSRRASRRCRGRSARRPGSPGPTPRGAARPSWAPTRRSRTRRARGPRRGAARGPRGDVRLGPADERPGGDLVDDAVGGLRRRGAAASTSSASLTIRSVAERPSWPTPNAAPGSARLEAEQVDRPEAVRDADRGTATAATPACDEVGDDRRAGRRSPSRSRSRRRRGRRPRAAGSLEARHDERRRPGRAADDEHRQPLERHGRVAGQVAQVRPDADEQRVEPGLVAPRPSRPRRAVPRTRSARDRRSRGDRHRAGRRRPAAASQRGDRRRAVLEQLAVREDASAPASRARLRSARRRAARRRGPARPASRRAADRDDAVVGPGGQVDDHGVGRGRAPGSRPRASGPARRRRRRRGPASTSRVDQIRSSARTSDAGHGPAARVSRASRRGAGRRRGR